MGDRARQNRWFRRACLQVALLRSMDQRPRRIVPYPKPCQTSSGTIRILGLRKDDLLFQRKCSHFDVRTTQAQGRRDLLWQMCNTPQSALWRKDHLPTGALAFRRLHQFPKEGRVRPQNESYRFRKTEFCAESLILSVSFLFGRSFSCLRSLSGGHHARLYLIIGRDSFGRCARVGHYTKSTSWLLPRPSPP